ncbi:MAG: tagatose 1,6-diphosphate aldolase [Chloroflexota bacterium]
MDNAVSLSIGKIRGLDEIATPEGIFTMCAMDHRGSLQKMLNPANPDAVTYEQMVAHKLLMAEALAPHSSGVLLDPIYGAAQCIAGGVLPGSVGLLVSLEATGYTDSSERRRTEIEAGWSVGKIKRTGASVVKLLVYYNPDVADVASAQRQLVRGMAAECAAQDIPLLVETVSYPVGGQGRPSPEFAGELPRLVVATAREVASLPIDVLKAEFPADADYEKDEGKMLDLCRQVTDASPVPWVVLSGGVARPVLNRCCSSPVRRRCRPYSSGVRTAPGRLACPGAIGGR